MKNDYATFPEKDFICLRSERLFLSKKAALDSARARRVLEGLQKDTQFHIAANFERKGVNLTPPSLLKLLQENSYAAAMPKVNYFFLYSL